MKTSAFRNWLNEKWFEHKDEVLMYGGEPFPDAGAYFRKYKWWLKTVYQKEMKNG
jgi:hypothetical protein